MYSFVTQSSADCRKGEEKARKREVERNSKGKMKKGMIEGKRGIKHVCSVDAHAHFHVSTDARVHGDVFVNQFIVCVR